MLVNQTPWHHGRSNDDHYEAGCYQCIKINLKVRIATENADTVQGMAIAIFIIESSFIIHQVVIADIEDNVILGFQLDLEARNPKNR